MPIEILPRTAAQ